MTAPVDTPEAAAPAAATPPRPVAFFLQAPGRTLGPLTRDELLGYFGAGLVARDAHIVGPEWDGALSAAAAAERLGVALREPAGPRDPAGLPALPPPPIEYRRAGPGWRLAALWIVALLAVQMAIVPARSIAGQPDLGAFLGAVAWRFALVALPCWLVVGSVHRLVRGLWPSALGPLLAASAVYAVLAAQFLWQPAAPAPAPPVAVAAPAAMPIADAPVASDLDPTDAWAREEFSDAEAPAEAAADAGAPVSADTAAAGPADATTAKKAKARVDADPMQTRARALYDAGQWQALLEHATAWTADEPDRQVAWMYLALAHERLGHRLDALAANERAHALDPDDRQVAMNLANSYLDLGRFRDAANLLETVLARYPDSHRALNDYGYAMSRLGEFDEAVAALERAVAIEPGYTLAWKNLSDAYQRAGHLDKAREVAERANARR